MTSDLCTDDVVVRITTPQILSSETIVPAGGAGAVGAGARAAASSAGVELGRRLLLAARAGDTPQVLHLMAEGAPFTTDWLGTSPLHMAAGNGHAETCAVLLRAGVSRDARTKVERTPLHLAACAGHADAAALLLGAGAAVDARDMLRMTPLHWAAQRGHASTAAALLAAGADPRAVSKFGKTPLALARAARHAALLRMLEDALRQREAARSVQHLVSEQNAEAPPSDPQLQTFDTIQKIQDSKPNKTKQAEKVLKTENKSEAAAAPAQSGAGEAAAAQLLRRHGITLLPADHSSTVLSALQSGRTVVLSDAGKLMLKESSESNQPVVSKPSSSTTHPSKNMVLTATPVKSPPKPGMKIFTLNNKLLTIPKEGNRIPVKRIINPHDMQHVKFVQLPADAKLVSPARGAGGRRGVTSRGGPAVKIIMNKSNFHRLMATASRADTTQEARVPPSEIEARAAGAGAAATVGEEGAGAREGAGAGEDAADGESPEALRAQLEAAQRNLAALHRELRVARARLAHYEPERAP